jgi:hypothetical protein
MLPRAPRAETLPTGSSVAASRNCASGTQTVQRLCAQRPSVVGFYAPPTQGQKTQGGLGAAALGPSPRAPASQTRQSHSPSGTTATP